MTRQSLFPHSLSFWRNKRLWTSCRLGPDQLQAKLEAGLLVVRVKDTTLTVEAVCHSAADLQVLREVAGFCVECQLNGGPLKWLNLSNELIGNLPPNGRLVTVIDAARINSQFARLVVRGDNLEAFASKGLHFRLGIPPRRQPPVWPYISNAGRTVWPDGEDKLHTPAYTTVDMDSDEGWLAFDIYLHGNGTTCDWAEGLLRGTETRRTVYLSGPGGGWFPVADKIILAGDETALPAIGRILENRQSYAQTRTYIELRNADVIAELKPTLPQDVELLDRSKGEAAASIFQSLKPEDIEGTFLWFGGEKSEATRLRSLVRNVWDLPKKQHYIGAYWTNTAMG
ncbi:MAG: siderophore-interacting protein [Pseudomonadota bacterium]